jgi:hypothetical protein
LVARGSVTEREFVLRTDGVPPMRLVGWGDSSTGCETRPRRGRIRCKTLVDATRRFSAGRSGYGLAAQVVDEGVPGDRFERTWQFDDGGAGHRGPVPLRAGRKFSATAAGGRGTCSPSRRAGGTSRSPQLYARLFRRAWSRSSRALAAASASSRRGWSMALSW